MIGLSGATIAAWDGYKFDDPFPGYGRRHRRYVEARAKGADALRRILSQTNTIMSSNFHTINRQIDSYSQELATLASLHHSYAGEWKTLSEGLAVAARKAEAELAAYDRLANKVRIRDAAEYYAIAAGELPALNDKHIRFYETNDKKLKSLQKTALKEQGDVLGMLDSASADFQKLLAGASQASLQIVSSQ